VRQHGGHDPHPRGGPVRGLLVAAVEHLLDEDGGFLDRGGSRTQVALAGPADPAGNRQGGGLFFPPEGIMTPDDRSRLAPGPSRRGWHRPGGTAKAATTRVVRCSSVSSAASA